MKKRKLKSNGGVTFSKNVGDLETSVALTNQAKPLNLRLKKNKVSASVTNVNPGVKEFNVGVDTKKGTFSAYAVKAKGQKKPVQYGVRYFKQI